MANVVKRSAKHARLDKPKLHSLTPSHNLPMTAGWHLPCTKLQLTFCENRQRDEMVRRWIADGEMATLARRHPSVEFVLSMKANRVPLIKTWYANGQAKVKPLYDIQSKLEVYKACEAALAESGNAYSNFMGPKSVISQNDNPRGVWSPLHRSDNGLDLPLPRADGKW